LDPENRLKELKYKATLSNDLIIYIFSLLVQKLDKAQSSELIGRIINSWMQRVEKHVGIIRQEQVERISVNKMEGDTTDVLDIIVRAHETLPDIVRSEYIQEVLADLQRLIVDKK